MENLGRDIGCIWTVLFSAIAFLFVTCVTLAILIITGVL